MELLIGCGHSREKKIKLFGKEEWECLATLDCNIKCNPDYIGDLDTNYWHDHFLDDTFYEIHAYEVLEHCGSQGDYIRFFRLFSDFHRILKHGGYICGTVPWWQSAWAWGDPSHTRVLPPESFLFLSQKQYKKQLGKTAMTDFTNIYKADFDIIALDRHNTETGDFLVFILQAIKE